MHLLLVEDEPIVTKFLLLHFASAGFAADLVATRAAAVAAVLRRSYDVIVLDLRLPDGDGLDVLRTMRHRGIETPVVIQSGHGTMEAALEAGRFGVVRFLEKPVDPLALLEAIRAAAVETASDPLAWAREELKRVGAGRTGAVDACLGILARTMADRSLTLRQFDRLATEMKRLASTPAATAVEAVAAALDDASLKGRQDDPELSRVLDVIGASKDMAASTLAGLCGMSTRAFCLLLSSTTSRSVRHWARTTRLKRSLARLVNSSDDIAQCAYVAGYPSTAPLDRDCHNILGLSPSRLRAVLSATEQPALPAWIKRTPPERSVNK